MPPTPDATPSNKKPSHHVTLQSAQGGVTYGLVLSDGRGKRNPRAISRNPIQRTTLQTSSGETQYSDFSEPFKPIPQDNWSGGRGNDDFERDRSRFQDAKRLVSQLDGQLIIGPQEYWACAHDEIEHSGIRLGNQLMPWRIGTSDPVPGLTFKQVSGSERWISTRFDTPAAGYTAAEIYLWIRNRDYVGSIIVGAIYTNDQGRPGTLVTGLTGAITDNSIGDGQTWESGLVRFKMGTPTALGGASTFHVVLFQSFGNFDVGGRTYTVSEGHFSSNGVSWTAFTTTDDFEMYFRVVEVGIDGEKKFFQYKGAMYAITNPDDGSTPKLYLNGHRGVADSNSGALNKLKDATASFPQFRFGLQQTVVLLTRGKGSEEPIPWRRITDTSGTELTVSPDWNIVHDTTTEYVVLGWDGWQEITGHGITAAVTDVLVSKDVIYFAQGDFLSTGSPVDVRRANFHNNGGTWTARYATDTGNKARWLAQTLHPDDGLQVWRGLNDEGTGEVAVSRADAKAWGTNLSFGSDLELGNDRDDLITGIENYGSPETLWILMTGGIQRIVNDIPERVPIRELASVRSFLNGKAHLVHGVYLYFSLLHSIERYFSNNLDDIGPSRDAGLPAQRQGPVSALEGYPGQFFAAIDGGRDGKSSILLWNQLGWHEVYRSSNTDQRIRNLKVQAVPGDAPDRLWFSEGVDINSVNLPSLTFDPSHDAQFKFTHEAHLITSWYYANLKDVLKLFKSLKIFAENLVPGEQFIDFDYQLDGDNLDSQWTTVSGTFDTVPLEEIDLSATHNVTGRRIRFRLRLYTDDGRLTPKIKATLLEALTRISTKFSYTMTFKVVDNAKDMNGSPENYSVVETLISQLDTWANAPTVLLMRSNYSPYDNKFVVIDPNSMQPLILIAGDTEEQLANLVVVEV